MATTPQDTPRPGLIFIPDISGFTTFVHETDISHSQHIIRELLEVIIDANTLGMEVSEVEGDAVLFYRMGKAPDSLELFEQVRNIYNNFHTHLKRYESQRICHCGACTTASQLKLKMVAHYGELGTNQVRNFTKLFGKDLIVAHRMLKNSIELDEYIVITRLLAEHCPNWDEATEKLWTAVAEGHDTYDFGPLAYLYVPLEPLYPKVPEPKIEDHAIDGATMEIWRSQWTFDAPVQMVFDVLTDLSYRHHWQPALKNSTELNTLITQNGSEHRCVIKGTDSDPLLVSHDFQFARDSITWTETEARNAIVTIFRVEKLDELRAMVTMAVFLQPNPIKRLFFQLFLRRRFNKDAIKSCQILTDYFAKLQSDGRRHTSQVNLPQYSLA